MDLGRDCSFRPRVRGQHLSHQAGWLASVYKEAIGQHTSLFWRSIRSVAGSPTMSYLSDFACGTPLLITSTVKLAQNTDFLSLVTETEW